MTNSKSQRKTKIKIVDRKSPVLREVAKEVPLKSIRTERIQKIIAEMKSALSTQDDGVAIAAPQIGESLRIFVVSGKVFGQDEKGKALYPDMTFINPEIKKVSKKKHMVEEGCLSVRWLYGEVARHEKATVVAYDEKGKKISIGASGLLAQIFQHETDHLNGVLFIDKAKNVKELPPEHDDKKL